MTTKWTHPTLGDFEDSGSGWRRRVTLPAFKAFSYNTGFSNAPRLTGVYKLDLENERPFDPPLPGQVELAARVVANQGALAQRIVEALWEDFAGRGPQSGMWWHGDLETVRSMASGPELLGEVVNIDGPADLYPLLRLDNIIIHRRVDGLERPVAGLWFHAAFEEEHGVGVLTDGEQILGLGYATDVEPFEGE